MSPRPLPSDAFEIGNQNAGPAPSDILLIMLPKLWESVGISRDYSIERQLLFREQMPKIFDAGSHEAGLSRLAKPSELLRERFLRRQFPGKKMIGAGRDHHLAEKFILVGEMAVDRLHGDARGPGDRIHGCPGESIPQKVLTGAEHDLAVFFGNHGCLGVVLPCSLP